MTRTIFVAAALALAATLPVAPAQAQTRVFVATGSDSNSCINVASPCRHFQAAYNAMPNGGEIDVLDPANYGALTATHTLGIVGRGWATLSPVAGQAAITINAGASDKINISGLTLDGANISNTNGIVFNSGASLTVRDSVIQNFTNNGINFVPTIQSTLSVSNTVVADNGVHGIAMKPNDNGSFIVFVGTFTRVEAYNNGTSGIAVIGDLASTQTHAGVNAIAIDCVATGNNYTSTSTGFLATSSQGIAIFRLFRSTAVGNFVGASAVSTNNAVVSIGLSQSNMELSRSSASASGTNAVVLSYGDNFTGGQTIAGSTTLTE